MRMRKTLITLLFISVLAARQPIVYFYVIPFDNLKDDPTIEWISSGLSDMVSNKFKNEPSLLIQNKQDLEVIMNDRSLMLKQPIASRNLLLLGKYSRQLEKINISVDESSYLLGYSKKKTFMNIHVPFLRNSLLFVAILISLEIIRELPITLILRPFNFETFATTAYISASEDLLEAAAVPSLFLILIATIFIMFTSKYILREK